MVEASLLFLCDLYFDLGQVDDAGERGEVVVV